jgi:hypothetical protein
VSARLGPATLAWILAWLIGFALACFLVLTGFALHRPLPWLMAEMILVVMMLSLGLPLLILGPLLAAPVILSARAGAWPRPLTDCGLGVVLALIVLAAGHVLFGDRTDLWRGMLGPLWVDLLCAATCGAIGGGAYWLLAGQPAPPYRASGARR